MNYKLVSIDMDGTLLDSQGMIAKENVAIIRQLIAQGVHVVICTGRNDILVRDYAREIGIVAPVIGCNGASVRDLSTDTLYVLNAIPPADLTNTMDYLIKNNIHWKAFDLEKGYATHQAIIDYTTNFFNNTYSKALTQDIEYVLIDDPARYAETVLQKQIIKIVLVQEDPEQLLAVQRNLKALGGIDIYRSSHAYLDIVKKDVSKGNALKQFAEKLGITREEIVAIGDSENDLSMIQYAGFSVAMGNAEEIIKKNSDFITSTNDEAGVSKALKKIFFDSSDL